MNRISQAFRSFFAILFSGNLPPDIAQAFGYSKAMPVKTATPTAPKPQAGPAEGAVQVLGILQREARLVDFLMEDISAYSDEQIGAAVRDVQAQSRKALERYVQLQPVIDGVEETVVKTAGLAAGSFKLVGNVPPSGTPASGLLRHKGWRAGTIDLPSAKPGDNVLAPAEIEVE
jgi:hypothetical protein